MNCEDCPLFKENQFALYGGFCPWSDEKINTEEAKNKCPMKKYAQTQINAI